MYDHVEDTACPLCEARDVRLITKAFDPCRVVRCRRCGLAYLSPRWTEDEIRSVYASDDYYKDSDVGYSDYQRQTEALRMTFRKFMGNLHRRGITGGRLLEIGCGFGYLLEAARPFFSFRAGTDYSPGAVREAARAADTVYLGGLEAIDPGERFDVVVLNQVIEHVYRPVAFLRELRERLSPGGRIVLATPDMNSPLRYLLGSRWPSYKIPEHVLYFDRASLTRTLREAGFDSIARIPYPHAFPLGLLLEKFRLPRPGSLDSYPIWVPWTTLAIHGKKAIV